jgi:hypothetical protein
LPRRPAEVLCSRITEIPGKDGVNAIRCRESSSKLYPCQEFNLDLPKGCFRQLSVNVGRVVSEAKTDGGLPVSTVHCLFSGQRSLSVRLSPIETSCRSSTCDLAPIALNLFRIYLTWLFGPRLIFPWFALPTFAKSGRALGRRSRPPPHPQLSTNL